MNAMPRVLTNLEADPAGPRAVRGALLVRAALPLAAALLDPEAERAEADPDRGGRRERGATRGGEAAGRMEVDMRRRG